MERELIRIPSKDSQQGDCLSSEDDENEAEKWEVMSLYSKRKDQISLKYINLRCKIPRSRFTKYCRGSLRVSRSSIK